MNEIKVSKKHCPADHPCPLVLRCPSGAISQEALGAPVIDQAKCTSCGVCIRMCPYRAIYREKVDKKTA